MGAKKPKQTPAQKALEAAQLHRIQEQEREINEETARTLAMQGRLLRGELGSYAQLSSAGGFRGTPYESSVNPAQAYGAILPTPLNQSATDAIESEQAMLENAGNPLDRQDLQRLLGAFAIKRRIP